MERKYKEGQTIRGKVTGIQPYGAFVSIDPFYQGLIHISEITDAYVKDVADFVQISDTVHVKILSIDEDQKKMSLSLKALKEPSSTQFKRQQTHFRVPRPRSDGFAILANKLDQWINEQSVK